MKLNTAELSELIWLLDCDYRKMNETEWKEIWEDDIKLNRNLHKKFTKEYLKNYISMEKTKNEKAN